MSIVETRTIALNITVEGPADAPAIVFSNSLGANLSMWEPQAAHFRERFRVVRYDQRGLGLSEVPQGPYSFTGLVEDVVALADALGLERFHFVGLSMGGMTALGLALTYPQRLLSVTPANCVAGFGADARRNWEERIATVTQGGLEPLLESTLERWFTAPTRAARPAQMQAVREMVAATPVQGYVGCCGALEGLDYDGRLEAITTPTLFIAGSEDPSTTASAMRAMHARVAGSRYVELPAAHVSNLECPDAFNDALDDFFATL
ncbi:MAG: 3-oxoadipate enol-lactonase [Gammaproteobacteria bacterium]